MRKLTLKVEELRLASFQTVAAAEVRGTVRAHDALTDGCTLAFTCGGESVCYCVSGGPEPYSEVSCLPDCP